MERKKVIIESSKMAKELSLVEQKEPVDNLQYLEQRVSDCRNMLHTLLILHTQNSNCCPDITRRLRLTIGYVGDIELK